MLRVLVVDDEEPIRRMLIRLVERRGHRVDQAGEGGAALRSVETAEAEGGPYDLIFSDLRMPGMDGGQLVQKLVERDAAYARRVVLLTGDVTGSERFDIPGTAGVPVVHKPFDIEDITHVLERFEQLRA